MPSLIPTRNLPDHGVNKIVSASTDAEFMENLILTLSEVRRDGNYGELTHTLEQAKSDLDADIEHICTSNHQEFVKSINKLDRGREDCTQLGSEILKLVQSYQESTDKLAHQKKELVDSRGVRQNLNDSADALKECLDGLRLSNQVLDLVGKQNHYAALRALDELQSPQASEGTKYKIGELIQKSIPATRKMIADAVMTDLKTWLYRIREVTQVLGEVAFYHTEQRRARQRERHETDQYLGSFKLNSAMELVADESEEFDVLNNDDVQVDFTPLFECLHIHDALGHMDTFRTEYAATRRTQKDLLLPTTISLDDEDVSDLKSLLEGIAGFSIIERATVKRTENLRASVDVDELWVSMCQTAISLMSSAIQNVKNPDILFKVTGVVSLFIQTMNTWDFYASSLDAFLVNVFERHAHILKDRCSEDFQEIVSTDDYMPMPIESLDEYDKIIEVGWYTPEKDRNEVKFPTVLPFSQMYPMCCIDIRDFLNQVYSIPDDQLPRSGIVDDIIQKSLDDLLGIDICKPLTDRLSSQYPGQIVQIMTNLEHFEHACIELQTDLAEYRRSGSSSSAVSLNATEQFRAARIQAKERLFELVNSKIDDLVETAEYDWSARTEEKEPGTYMRELTRYLANIMNTVLLGLPSEMKEPIYCDALDRAGSKLIALPLDPAITLISPQALHNLVLDVNHLVQFVSSQPSAQELQKSLDELEQTVGLMQSDNLEAFFDKDQRDKKYDKVNPQNGALLLEKVDAGRRAFERGQLSSPAQPAPTHDLWPHGRPGERLAGMMRGLGRNKDKDKDQDND